MTELKPCPFCGGKAVKVVDEIFEKLCGVKCFNCDAMIDAKFDFDEAVKRWNRRVTE